MLTRAEQNKISRLNLMEFKLEAVGKKFLLQKYEIFIRGEWSDYTLVSANAGKVRTLKNVRLKDRKLVLETESGQQIFLKFVYSSLKPAKDSFTIVFDDTKKLRWYKGRGMRLTYVLAPEDGEAK